MILPLLVAVALLTPSGSDLLGIGDSPPGEGLPDGWRMREIAGVPPPRFSVRDVAGEPVLHVEGMGAAAWAYRELDTPIGDARGVLRWSWRVLELPAGTDLRVEARDDAALRLYVVFGKPGLFRPRPGRVIFYTWGNAEPEGLTLASFVSERFHIVRVAGAMEAGEEWDEQAVEPFADYRRFWKGRPPPITAVGLMQDTDMTGGTAVSQVRSLEWLGR